MAALNPIEGAEAPRGRSRLRLRARLSLSLFLLVGACAIVVSLVALFLVEQTFGGELEQRLTRLESGVRRALRVDGEQVQQRLSGLEETLRRYDTRLLEQLLTSPAPAPPEVVAAAASLMQSADLDLLEILDGDGRILSSGHYALRVDTADPAALELLDGPHDLRRVELPMGDVPAVVASHRLQAGRRQLILFGGLVLDRDFLDGVASGEAAVLLDGERRVRAVGGRAPELNARTISARLARSADGGDRRELGRIGGLDGGSWSARSVALSSRDGEPVGHLVVAVDRAGFRALIRRLRWSFAILGASAALLGALAGVAIAGRLTRPVAELVRSVDAIARGEADYTFPRQADHELDELVASFSRLHRSLAAQQQRALAAERVAAWRDMARRVAHEIKNPLVPIRLTVENLVKARRQAPQMFDELFTEGSRTILEEVQALRRMVEEFSEFARLPRPRPQPTDLDELVDSVLALHSAEPGVAIRRPGVSGLPPIALDADQVSRALKNVVGNALEAMADRGGELTVETVVRDGWALVRVSDEGPGFSSEALKRVFEPYFTTKDGGTGLGMAITYRIVTEHGGMLTVENRPQGGATVVLHFPLRSATPVEGE